jgi:hypothetical protein
MTAGTRCAALLLAWTALLPVVPGCARQDSPSPGSAPAAASSDSADATLPATARQVLGWLPGDRSVAGWKRARAPQVFGADNLWESIDGGADAYVTYGFQELVTLPCVEPAIGGEATIEVYRMADPLGAFGIYAQEHNPNATFIAIGAEGYTAPNIVNFWNGPYYVKLTAIKTSDRIATALLNLANEINARIGPPAAAPAGALALPPRDQVAHSVKYLPRDVLGQSYLANGFEAQYRIGEKSCRLVTASFDSAQDAVEGFTRYRKFVASSGRVGRKLTSPGEDGFAGSDSFNGSIVAVRVGTTMVVTLGAPSERAALELIDALLARSPSRR